MLASGYAMTQRLALAASDIMTAVLSANDTRLITSQFSAETRPDFGCGVCNY